MELGVGGELNLQPLPRRSSCAKQGPKRHRLRNVLIQTGKDADPAMRRNSPKSRQNHPKPALGNERYGEIRMGRLAKARLEQACEIVRSPIFYELNPRITWLFLDSHFSPRSGVSVHLRELF